MFEKFILEQNSHWKGQKLEEGFPREATENLLTLIAPKQIITLVGVRRCGKSTILRQIINHLIEKKKVPAENILFLNLEAPLLDAFKNNPHNLQKIFEEYQVLANPQKGRLFIFLDEVQFFSNWQVFVKSLYEKGGVKFFITGSNSQLLSADMATLLSGRSITRNIHPFDLKEIAVTKKIGLENKLALLDNETALIRICRDYIKFGGFPEIVLEKKPALRKEILANYYRSILYQDIIPRFEIKKTKEIESLLLYLFSNIGQSYSYNSLGKFLKIHDKTVKEYIGFFEKSFLLFEISNYQYSIKKQENYPKKVYAVDNGFIDVASFSFSENYGRFLENTVFAHLQQNNCQLYYYRDKRECDFIIKEKTKVTWVFQVTQKLDVQNEKRELGGLLEAMEKFKLKKGFVITENQEETRQISGKLIQIVPLWKWLLDF